MSGCDAEATTRGPVVGFLTVIDHSDFGLFGGYLLLNAAGRPLEFHCTAPIKPNRAQQILYGPTLQPFLYGEQIGQTLVKQAGIAPALICTDREPALAVREHIPIPVVLVLGDEASAEPSAEQGFTARLRIDGPHNSLRLATFTVGRNRLALPERAADDRPLLNGRLMELGESFDLAEPFQRIREAIEEARQAVR